jgi:hypothetical protein
MMTRPLFAGAVLTLALVTTSASAARPIQVTRFTTPGELARGPAAPAVAAASLEQSTYDAAVSRKLADIGFTGEGSARYVYKAEVTKDIRRNTARRSPVTIGIGGGTGGYGGGFGIGGSFGIGSNRNRDTTVTTLSVKLIEHSTDRTVWEGRAEAESTAPGGESVDRLAAALFKDFPGQSGRTISVK